MTNKFRLGGWILYVLLMLVFTTCQVNASLVPDQYLKKSPSQSDLESTVPTDETPPRKPGDNEGPKLPEVTFLYKSSECPDCKARIDKTRKQIDEDKNFVTVRDLDKFIDRKANDKDYKTLPACMIDDKNDVERFRREGEPIPSAAEINAELNKLEGEQKAFQMPPTLPPTDTTPIPNRPGSPGGPWTPPDTSKFKPELNYFYNSRTCKERGSEVKQILDYLEMHLTLKNRDVGKMAGRLGGIFADLKPRAFPAYILFDQSGHQVYRSEGRLYTSAELKAIVKKYLKLQPAEQPIPW